MNTLMALVLVDHASHDIQDFLDMLHIPHHLFRSGEALIGAIDSECGKPCVIIDLEQKLHAGIAFHKYTLQENLWLPFLYVCDEAKTLNPTMVSLGAVAVLERPVVFATLQRSLAYASFVADTYHALSKSTDYVTRLALLTAKETTVAQLVASGAPNKQIARSLNVSIKTVERYRRRLYEKLDVRSAAELTRAVTVANLAPLLQHSRAA